MVQTFSKISEEHIGLSIDDKPIGRPGEIFTEVDTGKKWIWHNEDWTEDLTLIYAYTEALNSVGG